jgi:hypothetical protein
LLALLVLEDATEPAFFTLAASTQYLAYSAKEKKKVNASLWVQRSMHTHTHIYIIIFLCFPYLCVGYCKEGEGKGTLASRNAPTPLEVEKQRLKEKGKKGEDVATRWETKKKT